MIDVYHFTPSREDIAADRRKALWGRFEQSSKAHFVPPELRIKPVESKTEHRTAKVKGRCRSNTGSAGHAWYPAALEEAMKEPITYGQTPASERMRRMIPGETIVFRAIDIQAGKQLRSGLQGLVWPRLDKTRAFVLNGSRELVRVQCIHKTPLPDSPEPQGGAFVSSVA